MASTTISVRMLQETDQQGSGFVYVSETASPGRIEISEGASAGATYQTVLDLGSAPAPARYLFVVGIELEKGHEEDFEAWYNTEHLPALAGVPGVNRASRYRRHEAPAAAGQEYPEYLALYDITAPDIAGNDAWRAAVETPWTIRLRPHFQAVWRGNYRLAGED